MTVLRTDRKHASNCMTEENGVEKVKKRKNFFRSLRFRILIILIILGIVPGVIVTYTMLHNYQNRAVAMLTETVGDQCDILSHPFCRLRYQISDRTGSYHHNIHSCYIAHLFNTMNSYCQRLNHCALFI